MKLKLTNMSYNVILISDDGRSAVVRYNNIPKGIGTSIGNAIRRTALAYIPGYAPIGFRFSLSSDNKTVDTIPEVKEDVMQVSSNISAIRLKCLCPEYIDEFYLLYDDIIHTTLKAKNLIPKGKIPQSFIDNGVPTEFKEYINNDGTFDTDRFYLDNIKVMNPDLILFTNGKLEPIKKHIRIKCDSGTYFTSSLDKKKIVNENNEADDSYTIVQSVYNPVIHSHFKVIPDDNIKTQESLEITVETDGSVSPLEVIQNSSNLLATLLTIFAKNNIVEVEPSYSNFGVPNDSEINNEQQSSAPKITVNYLTEDLVKDPVIYNAFKIMGLNNRDQIINGIQRGDIKRFFDKSNIPYSEEELLNLLDKANITGVIKQDEN